MNFHLFPKPVFCLFLITSATINLPGCAEKGKDQRASAAVVKAEAVQANSKEVAPSTHDARISEYLCHQPDDCRSSVLGATGREEAAWLQANGYPSSAELARLQQLSDSQLKAAADAGSVTALAVYGQRLALGSDTAKGLDALSLAADRGSIYAYYGLSKVYAERQGLRNIVESGAYLRVAYTLGDNKAGSALQATFPTLNPAENAAIDRRAASLYKTYAKGRAPRPRPIFAGRLSSGVR